ncbi:MAG: DinB family protein, partial [Bacteroidota bacterium]
MPRPDLSKVPEYYHRYINRAEGNDIIAALKKQTPALLRFFNSIPAAKRNYRYAKDKWTIKEVLQHMIDAERVFAYRGLCFARKDKTPLPSFDENLYGDNAKAARRDWKDMIEEFKAVRRSTELLFASFDKEQMN